MKKLTVSKINKTRKSAKGRLWVPSEESCICNMQYEKFKGPSRWKNDVVPQHFKRPHEFVNEKSAERRVLVRNDVSAIDQASGSGEGIPSNANLTSDASTQCNDTEVSCLKEENLQLSNQIHHLQNTLQRLDPALLSSSQLHLYTGLKTPEFKCLVSWLCGTSMGRRSHSPDDPATLTYSQKLLMVLMRQNLTQEDLACRFSIDQSSCLKNK